MSSTEPNKASVEGIKSQVGAHSDDATASGGLSCDVGNDVQHKTELGNLAHLSSAASAESVASGNLQQHTAKGILI